MVRQQDSSPQSDESTPNLLNTAFSESYSPTDSVFEEFSSKTVETAEKCEVPQKSADVESKYCETDVTTKDRSELEELREKPRKTQDALNSEREEIELQNQLSLSTERTGAVTAGMQTRSVCTVTDETL